MPALSIDAVADLAFGAGYRGEALATAVAIAKAESNLDPAAVGDVGIQTAVWGPSVGLWQVRSLKAETGTGKVRDASRLTDPRFNAASSYSISSGGTNFRPWSVFTAGTYRRHLGEAGRAGAAVAARGGSGSIAGVAPGAGGGVSADVVAAPAVPLAFPPLLSIGELSIAGRPRIANMAGFLLSAEVEFALDEAAELTLSFHNPDLALFGGLKRPPNFAKGDPVEWRSQLWTLVAIEVDGGDGGPRLTLTMRGREVEVFKRPTLKAKSRTNMSPTEYAQDVVESLGLRFMGQGSARVPAIGPATTEEGEEAETQWDVLRRLAGELGYVLYGHDGLVVFAKRSWLVLRTSTIGVSWPSEVAGSAVVHGVPEIRSSMDAKGGDTLRLQVAREQGEILRPGMHLLLTTSELSSARWIISRVGWNITSSDPVTVEAVEAVDPKVAKPRPAGVDAPPTAAGSPTASSTPAGRRLSGAERRTIFGAPGDSGRITQVTTPWGIKVSCHKEVAARFVEACEFANRTSKWRPRRIDSLAVRPIRGSNEPSLHSWALAWDFFSSAPGVAPPGGVWAATSAPDEVFRAAFAAKGFFLGADFRSRKDYPHIEWAGGLPNAGPPPPTATGIGRGGQFAGAGASGSW